MSAHPFAGYGLRRNHYNVIVADPPWLYQKQPGINGANVAASGAVDLHYTTMTNEQIAALPVADLAAPVSHLFLWITNPGAYGGRFSRVTPFEIAEHWGFTYRTMLTWVKTTAAGSVHGGGMGWYFRGATEHVLYCTRGKAKIPSALREPNVVMAPKSTHSTKPEAFFELIERVTEGPRIELFARAARPGWSAWGNEIEQTG